MDLDDLKGRWDAIDRRLDAQLVANVELVRELRLGKVNDALARMRRKVAIELGLNVVVLWWMASYAVARADTFRFFVPALALALGLVVLLATGVRQLIGLAGVDPAAAVASVQARVETVRVSLIRTTKWVFLLAPLSWTPLLVVVLDGFLGIDAYAALGGAYLAANLAFGMAALPLLWWGARRFATRFAGRPWLERILRDIGGQNLAAAQDYLASLR